MGQKKARLRAELKGLSSRTEPLSAPLKVVNLESKFLMGQKKYRVKFLQRYLVGILIDSKKRKFETLLSLDSPALKAK